LNCSPLVLNTLICSDFFTTCALVIMKPLPLIRKPVAAVFGTKAGASAFFSTLFFTLLRSFWILFVATSWANTFLSNILSLSSEGWGDMDHTSVEMEIAVMPAIEAARAATFLYRFQR